MKLSLVNGAALIGLYLTTCSASTDGVTSKKYTLVKAHVDFRTAQRLCEEGGGHIAGVFNAEQQAALEEHLAAQDVPEDIYGFESAWIGLTDQYREGKWLWEGTGSYAQMTYTAWGRTEPNSFKGHDEDCGVVLSRWRWKWADYDCKMKTNFVCWGLESINKIITPLALAENEDMRKIQLKGLRLVPIVTTYHAAVQGCFKAGGKLAEIVTEEDQHLLSVMLSKKGIHKIPQNAARQPAVWIAGSDFEQEGTFVLPAKKDGKPRPMTYTNWASLGSTKEPNDWRGDEDCIVANGALVWQWQDYSCTNANAAYVCQSLTGDDVQVQKKVEVAKKETEMEDNKKTVEVVEKAQELKLSFIPSMAIWIDAEAACQRGGGHLASIQSQEDQDTLAAMLAANYDAIKKNGYGQKAVWIGFNDNTKEGEWVWSADAIGIKEGMGIEDLANMMDKARESKGKTYTAWGGDEPNSIGNEDCAVSLELFSWKWADYSCANKQPFVCMGLDDPITSPRKVVDYVHSKNPKEEKPYDPSERFKDFGKDLAKFEEDEEERGEDGQKEWDDEVWEQRMEEYDLKDYTHGKYTYIPETASWSEAKAACMELGGSLATVRSKNDQKALVALLNAHINLVWVNAFGQRAAWLGGSDSKKEGNWEWVDGTKMKFKSWGPTEPNSIGDEDCTVALDLAKWSWADYKCSAQQPFVCEGLDFDNIEDTEEFPEIVEEEKIEYAKPEPKVVVVHDKADSNSTVQIYIAVIATLACIVSFITFFITVVLPKIRDHVPSTVDSAGNTFELLSPPADSAF